MVCACLSGANTSPLKFLKEQNMTELKRNPAVYFEIPVADMIRATKFYSEVFGFDFVYENIHQNEIAFLPFDHNISGISGALAKGEIYKPTRNGVVIYFATYDIQKTIDKAARNGGKELFPRTKANDYGYVAEIEDSEGNRIGLSELVK
jgi:predicted enzyme related to lactoylglutathione lyase